MSAARNERSPPFDASNDSCEAAARRCGAGSRTGITASAPGFFGAGSRTIEGLRNTVPDIKGTLSRLEAGGRQIVNMEMESSLLFHLAGALGHRAATICPVIGQPGRPDAAPLYKRRVLRVSNEKKRFSAARNRRNFRPQRQ